MTAILSPLTITTAVAVTPGSVFQFRRPGPHNLTVEAIFTYGSGGTTADAYLQTSLDGGTTWYDIANFHFTTATASKLINLSGMTPVTTPIVPTDGSMTANTSQDGLLGQHLRIKYVTTGTYAASTTLKVNAYTPATLEPQ